MFASAFVLVDGADDSQVVGLESRLDSLYFVLSTVATVGFGDVHAEGQLARALVTVQIVFDLVFVAALARVVASRLSDRPRPRRGR